MKERNPMFVGIGAALSALLLFALLLIQIAKPSILDLPAHWLGLAVLPVIVALFLGGYVTKFSGFGLEFEAAVNKPIEEMPLSVAEDAISLDGRGKSSVRSLNQLPQSQKVALKWLFFIEGQPGTYVPGAVEQYLEHLPNLEYLEIRRPSQEISCFLPTSVLKDDEPDQQSKNIRKFLSSLELGNVAQDYTSQVISLQISTDTSIVDALKKMRLADSPFAAVLSVDGNYRGVVLASELEKKVAGAVLNSV